jgi:hypothetical protein
VTKSSIASGALTHDHTGTVAINEMFGFTASGATPAEGAAGCASGLLIGGGCRIGAGNGALTRSLIFNNQWYCEVRSLDGALVQFSILAHCLTISPTTLP